MVNDPEIAVFRVRYAAHAHRRSFSRSPVACCFSGRERRGGALDDGWPTALLVLHGDVEAVRVRNHEPTAFGTAVDRRHRARALDGDGVRRARRASQSTALV